MRAERALGMAASGCYEGSPTAHSPSEERAFCIRESLAVTLLPKYIFRKSKALGLGTPGVGLPRREFKELTLSNLPLFPGRLPEMSSLNMPKLSRPEKQELQTPKNSLQVPGHPAAFNSRRSANSLPPKTLCKFRRNRLCPKDFGLHPLLKNLFLAARRMV